MSNARLELAAILLLLAACACPTAAAGPCETTEKRVAVMELKVSGDYSEQVQDWLPALIEDRLLAEGWTLVVRGDRMKQIQDNRELGGLNPDTKLPDQQIIDATAFLELTARIQVKDIQGLLGYKAFTFGDFARASVDLNGEIVDPATSLLKSSLTVGGSASGLKTALVLTIGSNWRIGAEGYNLEGIRKTLVGKAADVAASKLVERLRAIYPEIPGQRVAKSLQPASTTVTAEVSEPTILISLPENAGASVGDHYAIYRGGELVAEVEIARLFGTRAEARIITQSGPIKPTDTARKAPVVIKGE